jgi:DNA-binding IclR family transcriptional regulator
MRSQLTSFVGRERMVSRAMDILELLSDGRWHGVEELLLRTGLNEQKFEEVTVFLSKYDFVKVDKKNKRVKIDRYFKKLLAQPVS